MVHAAENNKQNGSGQSFNNEQQETVCNGSHCRGSCSPNNKVPSSHNTQSPNQLQSCNFALELVTSLGDVDRSCHPAHLAHIRVQIHNPRPGRAPWQSTYCDGDVTGENLAAICGQWRSSVSVESCVVCMTVHNDPTRADPKNVKYPLADDKNMSM